MTRHNLFHMLTIKTAFQITLKCDYGLQKINIRRFILFMAVRNALQKLPRNLRVSPPGNAAKLSCCICIIFEMFSAEEGSSLPNLKLKIFTQKIRRTDTCEWSWFIACGCSHELLAFMAHSLNSRHCFKDLLKKYEEN